MGSQPTKAPVPILQCPKNYDKQKFKKIMSLFDKLDKDSNLGVSSAEVSNIAALHVKNAINKMNATIDAKKRSLNVALTSINIDKIAAEKKLNEEYALKVEHEKLSTSVAIDKLQKRIDFYQSLDSDGKSDAFMRAVCPSGSAHLDFWSFFDYMKTRTDDIENIKDECTY